MNVLNTNNNTIQHQIFHESEMSYSISLIASVASDLFVCAIHMLTSRSFRDIAGFIARVVS